MQSSSPSISSELDISHICSTSFNSYNAVYAHQSCQLCTTYLFLHDAVDLPSPEDIVRAPTHIRHWGLSLSVVLHIDVVILESSFCRTLLCFSLQWEEYAGLYFFDMGPEAMLWSFQIPQVLYEKSFLLC